MKAVELRKRDKKELEKEVQELRKKLSDLRFKSTSNKLKNTKEISNSRKEIARIYQKAFEGKSFIKGQSGLIEGHAYHLYIIEIEDRKGLINYLRRNNVWPQVHYIPVHLMPYYRQFGWKEGDMTNAEKYYAECMSIPMFPTLSDEEQAFVIDTIYSFYGF